MSTTITLAECYATGTHLASVDDNGFCNACGEQEAAPGAWPTTKQFDDAAELGSQTALAEIRNGAEEPRESPLSGEFADEATERSIAEAVGFPVPEEDGDALEELGNAWERCYFDTWQHETEVKAEEV